jgi:hypothetical protein
MGQGQYDNHKNVMHKSPPQATQCKWLMQMELTFSQKVVLISLHLHDPYLEINHHPSSLQIHFLISGEGCIKMVKILATPKCNS